MRQLAVTFLMSAFKESIFLGHTHELICMHFLLNDLESFGGPTKLLLIIMEH